MTIDLSTLRNDNDVAAGFSVGVGIYQSKVSDGGLGEMTVQLPVMDVNFMMANGKTSHRISVPPDMVLALIATLSNWKMGLDQQIQQGAPPPAPPSGMGAQQ